MPAGRSFAIFVAGLTMTITPAKLGELLKSGLLKRAFDVPVRRSGPIVLAERVTDATGVVVLAVVGGASGRNWPLLVAAVIAVVAVVLVVRSPLLERFARLGEARGAARALLGTRLLVEMTLLSAVSWLFECLAAYVVRARACASTSRSPTRSSSSRSAASPARSRSCPAASASRRRA